MLETIAIARKMPRKTLAGIRKNEHAVSTLCHNQATIAVPLRSIACVSRIAIAHHNDQDSRNNTLSRSQILLHGAFRAWMMMFCFTV
jgi:hypothetical protein